MAAFLNELPLVGRPILFNAGIIGVTSEVGCGAVLAAGVAAGGGAVLAAAGAAKTFWVKKVQKK
ncbi:MAG: hypothetical protein K1X29_04875 [Bdellovibrionales bacterium]|nr:hypothetical protein [Bdellovibrionales bacterium]